MALSPQTFFNVKILAGTVSLLLTAIYLFSGSASHTHPALQKITSALPSLPGTGGGNSAKAAFVSAILRDESEVGGPFDNRTLVALCSGREWTPGLIFKCEAPEGGIGNVRNVFLNCVRYAIEAGATSFIVPEIILHTTSAPAGTAVKFGHYFDLPHFTSRLQETCPQISLIANQNDLYAVPSTAKAVILNPTAITTSLLDGYILGLPGNWSTSFHAFLDIAHPVPPSAAKPVLVSLQKPLLQFPLSFDDPLFVANFGRLLRFREDVRRVAAGVLYGLDATYSLGLGMDGRKIEGGKFYGAHLRTGKDAAAAGWTPYAVQARNYLGHAANSHLSLIYTTPSPSDLSSFITSAAAQNISVETARSLLGSPVRKPGYNQEGESSANVGVGEDGDWQANKGLEEEWGLLQGLSWDQRLLVDFEVLLRSSVFGGTWESSLSWNIAMRRHVVEAGSKGWTDIAVRSLPSLDQSSSLQGKLRKGRGHSHEKREQRQRRQTAELSEKEKELEALLDKEKEAQGKPASVAAGADKEGESSWRDGLSVVFGPEGEGKRVRGTLWP